MSSPVRSSGPLTGASSRSHLLPVREENVSQPALAAAVELVGVPILFARADLAIVAANAAAADYTGYKRAALCQMRLDELLVDDAASSWHAGVVQALRNARADDLPALLRACDGASRPVRFDVQALGQGADRLLIVALQPPRETQKTEPRPPHAQLDFLTELPTRSALEYRLKHAELRARGTRSRFAVLFVDLDRFKQINDAHGHRTGDMVLQVLGDRLRACLRPGDFVARYGGDEFVVLLEQVHTDEEVERIAARIRQELATHVELGKLRLSLTASVGVAIGHAYSSATELVEAADHAMYAAKRA